MPTLDWATREADLWTADRVPYRLISDLPHLGAGAGSPNGLLVQGDNLEALKALLPFYGRRVRCIYIDPPYNTRSAFQHYDDNLEHAKWLGMIVPRLQLLREFLSDDGSIWVSIDDNEGHYLKVVMDELFGRQNFQAVFVWERDAGSRGDAGISNSHDYILCYANGGKCWSKNVGVIPRTGKQAARFRNPDDDPRGPWRQGDDATAKSGTEKQRFPITTPTGKVKTPSKGRYWAYSFETFMIARMEGRTYFGQDQNRLPIIKRYLSDAREGVAPRTWWPADIAGTNQSAKRDHLNKLMPEIENFDTPKPETLLQRILHIATDPGDLVLDSFLGSGTTAAVAHKMGRRWIGVELGDHARTHAAARLRKVVEGEQGGISEAVGWSGGGAFRFATLGAPVFDADGRINPDISWSDLAAHVWFAETRRARNSDEDSKGPLIGVHEGGAVALLWNGVLKDRSVAGGNVLVHSALRLIRDDIASRKPGFDGPLTVYGAATRLSTATLKAERITFKQTPYAVARRA